MDQTGFEPSGSLAIAVWARGDRWMSRIVASTRPEQPLDLGVSPRLMTADEICDAIREWLFQLRDVT
jgi:hypothetical protein